MNKNIKIAIIAIIVVIIGGLIFTATSTELFQGSLFKKFPKKNPLMNEGKYDKPLLMSGDKLKQAKYYLSKGKIVSGVTSPVPSVVTSNVPSSVGTSKVVSKVPSVVTSPVTSGVPLKKENTSGINPAELQILTSEILNEISKQEFKSNPAKFTLSREEKARIIKIYEDQNRKINIRK